MVLPFTTRHSRTLRGLLQRSVGSLADYCGVAGSVSPSNPPTRVQGSGFRVWGLGTRRSPPPLRDGTSYEADF